MSRSVQLGRTYRCDLCGAQVMVLRAASQALEPHCCNQPMAVLDPVVGVYHCKVCGIEVAVLRGQGGALDLICCHEPMDRRPSPVPKAA